MNFRKILSGLVFGLLALMLVASLVSLIDTKGKAHRLRELAGQHYTGLVLGCLT